MLAYTSQTKQQIQTVAYTKKRVQLTSFKDAISDDITTKSDFLNYWDDRVSYVVTFPQVAFLEVFACV